MQILFWVLVSVLTGYLLLILLMYISQSGMMYHPVKEIHQTPSVLGLDFEDVRFSTKDGVTLHGWHVPAADARGTVLFSHGNAGNISGRLETIRILHGLGVNVLMYDYQGYGKSKGSPSEEATYKDVMAAWEFLTEEKNIPGSKIVLMGRSLGGGVAAWLATKTEPAGLILESTFTSAKDLAAELYPIFPVRWLMKFEYPTQQYLQAISVPVLVLHSKHDGLIPFHHGRELYESASDPKTFFEMQGSHGGGHIESGRAYIQALDDFFDSVLTEKTDS